MSNQYASTERHVLTGLSRQERDHLATRANDDGSAEGIRPEEVSADLFKRLGHEGRPLLSAIRAKRLDCCCEQPSEVAKCTSCDCALWPYRMGHNPFRAKRELTTTQREALAAAAASRRKTPDNIDANFTEGEGQVHG